MHEGRRFMRKIKIFLAVIGMAFVLTACGKGTNNSSGDSSQKEENHTPETTKTSPDKYTWYIKDYVGRNAASFGYTSIGGERMDQYGDGLLKIVFVNEDGSYIDISKEEELKKQQLQMDIYNAILRHKEALQEEEAWELSVRQAQENYRIMQNRYMNQLAILTDLLDANSVLLNAELQLTSSRTRIIYTYYQLQKACGRL